MGFLAPKTPTPPPPPPPPPEPDMAKAGALAEEALMKSRGRRKGAGATKVAGLIEGVDKPTTQKPTLLG